MPHALELRPFRPNHAAGLGLHASIALALRGLPPLAQLSRAYAAAGPAWTLFAGDWPLVCGGAVRFWDGVGELWCFTSAEAERFGVGFARLARARVAELLASGGFHRLQAHVREDDSQARRFARFLGLNPEGRCPGYGPDRATHLLFGRYRQCKVSAR